MRLSPDGSGGRVRPGVPRHAAALSSAAARAEEGNPRIDGRRFAAGAAEVESLRESRRIDEDAFPSPAAPPDTVAPRMSMN